MEQNQCAYYLGTVESFLSDAASAEVLTRLLVSADEALRPGRSAGEEQVGAWKSGIVFLKEFLDVEELSDTVVALEVSVSGTGERVDAVLCGRDEKRFPHIILLEFKTWHTERRLGRRYEFHPFHDAATRGLVVNLYDLDHEPVFDQLSSSIEKDPRRQVDGYKQQVLKALEKTFPGKDFAQVVEGAVVLYNCVKLSQDFRKALDYATPPEDPIATSIPVYTGRAENGSRSTDELREQLVTKLQGGDGEGLYAKLAQSLAE